MMGQGFGNELARAAIIFDAVVFVLGAIFGATLMALLPHIHLSFHWS